MEFRIDQSQLAIALEAMMAVSFPSQTISISPDSISTVSFSSVVAEGHVKATVLVQDLADSGPFTIEGKTALPLLRQAPGGLIRFDADKSKLLVSAPGYRVKLPLLSVGGPQWPEENATVIGSTAGTTLADMIKDVQPFADPNLIVMTHGIHMKIENGQILLEACDGKRVAKDQLSLATGGHQKLDVTVGSLGMKAVAALFNESYHVNIAIPDNGNWVQFINPAITFNAQLMDGMYPDINNIYQDSWDSSALVDRKALLSVLSSIELLAGPSAVPIVELRADTNKLSVSSPDKGEATISVDLPAAIVGNMAPPQVMLNAHYVAQAARCVLTDRIRVSIQTEPRKPVGFEQEGTTSPTWLVLPLIK